MKSLCYCSCCYTIVICDLQLITITTTNPTFILDAFAEIFVTIRFHNTVATTTTPSIKIKTATTEATSTVLTIPTIMSLRYNDK